MKPNMKRAAPAFLVYAAEDLACATYYCLTFAARGLLDSMRRAIWVDGSVPAATDELALTIRRPVNEVVEALTDAVLRHFVPGSPERLTCPELDRQRATNTERRQAQQQAAAKTNAERHGRRVA